MLPDARVSFLIYGRINEALARPSRSEDHSTPPPLGRWDLMLELIDQKKRTKCFRVYCTAQSAPRLRDAASSV